MPDPTLDQAITEAYAAANPERVIIPTLALHHAGLVDEFGNPGDIYLFNGENPTSLGADGTAVLQARLEDSAPRRASQVVLFIGVPFEISVPGTHADPAMYAEVTLDNVMRDLSDLLTSAAQSGYPIEAIYREYLTGLETVGPSNDPPLSFRLTNVRTSGTKVTGRLALPSIGNRRFPFDTYTPDKFPTLEWA